ncbi:MAG TPA: hypothetical protein VMP42_08015 [Actinomycetota bacterium]|nr:hypothetical protein [Actinomycetota bacterium]
MAIDERSRHRMYERLQEVLGEEEAATLMEHLPPVGWADVAAKRDLDGLQNALLARFRAELNEQTRTMIHAMIFSTSAAVLAVGSLAVAAVRL